MCETLVDNDHSQRETQPLLGERVQVLVLGSIRHPHLGPVRNELDRLLQLAALIVHLLHEVQLQVVARVQIRLEDVLDLRQVEIGIVLLEVLVVDAQADQLRQEGAGEPRPHQLPIRSTERRLVQTLADHLARELEVLQLQMGRSVRVRVDQGLPLVVECTEETTTGVK
uniref:Uncharacterized protein n=1 Tax=Anopheles farauti TaxID=69004 RepID=A0A182QXN5_9DIPT